MKNVDREVCCPACGWQYDYQAHWDCLCQNHWDMISTGGRCPDCFKDWEKIRCPEEAGGCGVSSPYMDWYGDLNKWLSTEIHELNTSIKKETERRGSRGL